MNTFVLARWLKNPHLQTVGSVTIPRAVRVFPSQNRFFELPDGSKLVAECSWQKNKQEALTVVIIHGMNGSTISSYVRGTAAKAYGKGCNVVRLNLRNGGRSERYSKTLLHAGQSGDLTCVLDELLSKDGLTKVGLIGFSFGGNLCLKAVGELGQAVPRQLVGLVGISPLVDLAATVNQVDHHAPAIYRWRLLNGLKTSLIASSRLFPGKYDVRGLKKLKTLRAYDEKYAPYNGFSGADDYYAKASALPFLAKISVPTLIIQADDDAIIPAEPFRLISNTNIQVIVARGGGHGGFISQVKGTDPDLHWAENRAVEYLLEKGR